MKHIRMFHVYVYVILENASHRKYKIFEGSIEQLEHKSNHNFNVNIT